MNAPESDLDPAGKLIARWMSDETPPVRVTGHLVRAFDRGHHFDDGACYSQLQVEIYGDGPSTGMWGFSFYPDENLVKVEHNVITDTKAAGTWASARRNRSFEVSADLWRLNPLSVISIFVGTEIAAEAAPLFQ